MRPLYPEVTEAICLVPSVPFFQAPWYALPTHLCRFRVRPVCWSYFLDRFSLPGQSDKTEQKSPTVTSSGSRNINRVTIRYGFRPRVRLRLTLLRLPLSRNPWVFGERVSRSLYRYSYQHPHLGYLQPASRRTFAGLPNAPLPPGIAAGPMSSVHSLSPVKSSAQDCLFRPVSCYAFFKGWLLLSQPPGCFGLPTSFNT